ncbi:MULTISPECIES: murein L,D-transpeptidase family protein [Rhodomicrobium]|uniref:L,D-transpeptidase family protein n=1 Tax=Rhodomicrobium TaxID=1068 RepID=UPI001FDA7508|nr:MULTISPECIES: murein L,D-transpeptidase family protein [Rhodomicrobium]
MKQLSPETQALLAKSGMTQESPIFVRIFKEESQLEIWKEKPDKRFYLFKTYPICTFSGELGPKVATGDKQSPEGFYTITPGQMNPNSQFHLAWNMGFPNAYDKANGRTGSALMVHGDCRSAGCYAMTDALIEEIYALARESFAGGQTKFQVHAFPFRMTDENMKRHRESKWISFWRTLKTGYDDFEISRIPPKVSVCSRNYLVNANFIGFEGVPDPSADCPAYRRAPIEPFNPFANQVMASNAPASSPVTTQASRLASYAPAATPAPKPQTAAGAPQRAAASQPTAAIPAQPAASAWTAPAQPAPRGGGNEASGVSLAGAVTAPFPPRPVVAQQQQQQQTAATLNAEEPQAAPEKKPGEPEVTRGMHNVVESSKSDMMPAR